MRALPAAAVVVAVAGGAAAVVVVAEAAHAPVVVAVARVAAAARAAGEGAGASVAVRPAVECRVVGAPADDREAAPGVWRDAAVADDQEVAGWRGVEVGDGPMSAVGEVETLGAREADVEWLI